MCFPLTVDVKVNQIHGVLERISATACEQEFWFGISRFMREIPNQRVCLVGSSPDITVTLTLFDTLAQYSTSKKRIGFNAVYFLLTVDDKFSSTDRLSAALRATAYEQEFWFGISRFMREIPTRESA